MHMKWIVLGTGILSVCRTFYYFSANLAVCPSLFASLSKKVGLWLTKSFQPNRGRTVEPMGIWPKSAEFKRERANILINRNLDRGWYFVSLCCSSLVRISNPPMAVIDVAPVHWEEQSEKRISSQKRIPSLKISTSESGNCLSRSPGNKRLMNALKVTTLRQLNRAVTVHWGLRD